jgi:hypothetical protein
MFRNADIQDNREDDKVTATVTVLVVLGIIDVGYLSSSDDIKLACRDYSPMVSDFHQL